MTELYSKRNPEWTGGEMEWNAFVNDGGIVYDKEIETKTKTPEREGEGEGGSAVTHKKA